MKTIQVLPLPVPTGKPGEYAMAYIPQMPADALDFLKEQLDAYRDVIVTDEPDIPSAREAGEASRDG